MGSKEQGSLAISECRQYRLALQALRRARREIGMARDKTLMLLKNTSMRAHNHLGHPGDWIDCAVVRPCHSDKNVLKNHGWI